VSLDNLPTLQGATDTAILPRRRVGDGFVDRVEFDGYRAETKRNRSEIAMRFPPLADDPTGRSSSRIDSTSSRERYQTPGVADSPVRTIISGMTGSAPRADGPLSGGLVAGSCGCEHRSCGPPRL
jgi:hypothetical protein